MGFGTRTRVMAASPASPPGTPTDPEDELAVLDADVEQWRADLSRLRTERVELESILAAGTQDVGPELAALDVLKQKLIW